MQILRSGVCQTLISGNLYQIYTYVKNYDNDNTGNVSGLLLYAKTDEELEPRGDYMMGKKSYRS